MLVYTYTYTCTYTFCGNLHDPRNGLLSLKDEYFCPEKNNLIVFSLNIVKYRVYTRWGEGGHWIKKIALIRHEILEQINKVLAASSKSYV